MSSEVEKNFDPSFRSKHYYQGGYDFDFVEDLDLKYECPICLLCQRDPCQTSCGHRFCNSCILTWLNEGKTCPKDNCSLGEGDIFSDSMAHREIMQLFIKCPERKSGCEQIMRLADVENHVRQCSYSSDSQSRPASKQRSGTESVTCGSCGELVQEQDNIGTNKSLICPNVTVACPYTSAGCADRILRKNLPLHLQTQTQKHMQLLCDKLLKVQQMQGISLTEEIPHESSNPRQRSDSSGHESLPETGLCRQESIRLSGSNIQSTQKLLKDLFRRIVQLEQKNCKLEIANQSLVQKLSHLQISQETKRVQDLGRFCNGKFVWRIENFSQVYSNMRQSSNYVKYSNSFYTSPYGYKMCLRCNISIFSGEEHLGLFLHLMQSENDDFLKWPFSGGIHFSILHMTPERLSREDFTEVLSLNQQKSALNRPNSERNIVGYGFHEFIRANGLYSGGYVSENDVLVIKVVVKDGL